MTGEPMLIPYLPNDHSSTGPMNVLLEERTGAVWCGAGNGLYRLEQTNGEWTLGFVEIGLPRQIQNDMRVRALAEDRNGALWIGAGSGLYRRWPDGRTERYTTDQGLPGNDVRTLLLDANGLLWVGMREGITQIALEPGTHKTRIIRVHTAKNGLRNPNTRTLFQSSTGQIWIGVTTALVEFVPQASSDGSRFRYYLSWFDGKRFRAIRPRVPRSLTYFGWGWNQLTLQDQIGEWWLPTGQGLVRYPKVNHVSELATTPPKAICTATTRASVRTVAGTKRKGCVLS